MIPYKADVMMQQMPWANWVIIGITVIVSLLALYGPLQGASSSMSLWCHDPKGTMADILRENPDVVRAYGRNINLNDLPQFHGYQLITYAFLHSGLWHLFGNMVFLFVFGNAVNAKMGHAEYAGLYLAFAAVTGLAWYLFPGDGLLMVGASGATMGIAGMFAVLYPLNEISIFLLLMWRPILFDLSSMWFLLIYFAMDFLGLLAGTGNVAHVSHVAGMVSGAALAAGFVLTGVTRPSPGERTLLEIFGLKVKREGRERRAPIGGARPDIPGISYGVGTPPDHPPATPQRRRPTGTP